MAYKPCSSANSRDVPVNISARCNDRKQAYDNLLAAIDFSKFLPDYVFKQDFEVMLFFYGCIGTMEAMVDPLYEIEASTSICVLELSAIDGYDFQLRGLTFPTKNMGSSAFDDALFAYSASSGIDTFGCMSNVGEWCIYMNAREDIAIFALRTSSLLEKYQPVISQIYADSIINLMQPEPIGRPPFNNYVSHWKESLAKNYDI